MLTTTLLYLIKTKNEKISEILLAMKKRGIGEGNWNGVGGKVETNESIEQGLVREVREEIEVTPIHYWEIAKISFRFTSMPQHNQMMHAYFCDRWEGTPTETEELQPRWFDADILPFAQMWRADSLWLPQALDEQYAQGEIVYTDFEKIVQNNLHFSSVAK